MVAGLLDEVRVNTIAYLENNRSRLTRSSHLISRFEKAGHAWSEKRVPDARHITETVNALLIAKRFLQDPLCAGVEYEPSLDGSKKTIDFLFHTTEGHRIFYDARLFIQRTKTHGSVTRGRTRRGGSPRARV